MTAQSPIAYALQFRGETKALGGGRFRAETRAPSCILVTVVGQHGVESRFEDVGSGEALCTRELELRDDGSFSEEGSVSFGVRGAIEFRAEGELAASPDPRLRHGAAVCEVTGGSGRLAGARGFVTSNFLLSDTGDLTDHQLGLLFVERPE